MNNFLKNLKVNDKVGLNHHYHGLSIEMIIKITKTMIITDKKRYNKNTGYEIGTGYYLTHLHKIDNLFIQKYNRQNYTRGIKNLIGKNYLELLTEEELKEIYQKLKKRGK